MAAYPFPNQVSTNSVEDWIDPVIVSRSMAGDVRGRRLQSGKKRVFTIQHDVMNASDRSTLQTFYDNNRALSFTFVWNGDGQTYTVIFADEKGIQWTALPGNYWKARLTLAQV